MNFPNFLKVSLRPRHPCNLPILAALKDVTAFWERAFCGEQRELEESTLPIRTTLERGGTAS